MHWLYLQGNNNNMALISIILGLLLDRRWNGLAQLRQFAWFSQISSFVLDKTDKHIHNPTARYLAVLAIPVLGTLFLQDMISEWSAPLAFLFAFIVFLYCLGTLEIEQQLEDIIESLQNNDNDNAKILAEGISNGQSIDDDSLIDITIQSSMDIIIERLFGVIFWFAILGPVGAIIYRLSQQLLLNYSNDPVFAKTAERMLSLLDWLPQRLLAVGFAITGHFEGALAAFHENKETDRTQQYLLMDVCHGSLEGNDREDKASYLSAFRGLLLRSLIVWLTCIALLTLLGWH